MFHTPAIGSIRLQWRIAWTLACAFPALAQTAPPLVLKEQGSFFVGGQRKVITRPSGTLPGGIAVPESRGDITVDQMYVQYQIPVKGHEHVPVVMVHGCCLSSKTWETTPDGRMGWSEYFVRRDRPVYLADQVSRARSGFDPTAFNEARAGKVPAAQAPVILTATHQSAWTNFRFGPKFGEAFPDTQFPLAAVEELYKQMIPDLNSLLPQHPNPTWTQMAALAARLDGAILMGHSQSGFFPQQAALIDAVGIRGMISIEPGCDTALTRSQIATLAKVPTLILFGDRLSETKVGNTPWIDLMTGCHRFVEQLKQAGGDAGLMHLPALGIKGNSHLPMQDKNNQRIAGLLIEWIDRHVEAAR